MSPTTTHYSGRCLCGAIQFEIEAFESRIAHCHCKMCQRFHGAAFSTFGEVKIEHLHWHSGESLLKHYEAENGTRRSFCQRCGSSLLFRSPYNIEEGTIEVALAALDHAEGLVPDAHIYLESQAPWIEVSDTLKKYPRYREA